MKKYIVEHIERSSNKTKVKKFAVNRKNVKKFVNPSKKQVET